MDNKKRPAHQQGWTNASFGLPKPDQEVLVVRDNDEIYMGGVDAEGNWFLVDGFVENNSEILWWRPKPVIPGKSSVYCLKCQVVVGMNEVEDQTHLVCGGGVGIN